MPPESTFIVRDDSTPEMMLKIILTTLRVAYKRQAEQLDEILQGMTHLHAEKLMELWQQLHQNTDNDEEAIAYFTEWIAASLDGGDLSVR